MVDEQRTLCRHHHQQIYKKDAGDEQLVANQRAEEARRLIDEGKATVESLLDNDIAREAIIPRLLEEMRNQNVTYAVVDGFPIPRQKVKVIPLDFSPWTIVLASDGYPFLKPTLSASEEALEEQRRRDPLNITTFKGTKAFRRGMKSLFSGKLKRCKVWPFMGEGYFPSAANPTTAEKGGTNIGQC